MPPPFRRILVANRAEIAVRVLRTCRRLGIEAASVHSEADARAKWVREADASYPLGAAPVAHSYLNVPEILAAARRFGAEAIHPGYGLLSEKASFARACAEAGFVFVGPPAGALERTGSKTASRAAAAAADVPVVPGSSRRLAGLDAAREEAKRLGFPVMLKADLGGGGIGIREVGGEPDLEAAWKACTSLGASAFGDGAVYVEKRIDRPRHLEMQVLVGAGGGGVALGERECSIQRRNQKVVEEAPSTALDGEGRCRMAGAALRLAAAVGYRNAGTVEFLLDRSGAFQFLEVNARLQVEHPVTEETTGLDLVEWQLRIAAGEEAPKPSPVRGHAIEFRVCAEDPDTFLPSPGSIRGLALPAGEGIRCDFGFDAGDTLPPFYDSLIGKLVVAGATRAQAIERASRALADLAVEGVKTNLPLLRRIAASEAFRAGDLSTDFLPRLQRTETG
ncbi:MAG TPA: biotin carboxylase N-terminal domain-containing protein [Planctomycetota bacterium]|jgi:acetyl-CoA carboxylase biotin carboxylase subunit|nr:biotin carboxylase N-terminal domain-containing protein [Planctomycetota bacterium]